MREAVCQLYDDYTVSKLRRLSATASAAAPASLTIIVIP
jgi:hypothetical protein